ncbi:MAG: hypothetical protein KAX24_07300, partial [Anaerolineae bacterium]|nr:hypothetical protein [Anaerolineae bacterium]
MLPRFGQASRLLCQHLVHAGQGRIQKRPSAGAIERAIERAGQATVAAAGGNDPSASLRASFNIIGPVPAFAIRARGRYRWQLFLRGTDSTR